MGFVLIALIGISFLVNLVYINWYAPRRLFHKIKNYILKSMGRKSQKEQKEDLKRA